MARPRGLFPGCSFLGLSLSIVTLACQTPLPEPSGTGDLLGSCLEQFHRNPTERASARCFFEAVKAEPHLDEPAAARLEELTGSHPELPWLSFYLGNLLWSQGDLSGAEARYRQAARVFASRGDQASEVDCRTHLLRLLRGRSESRQALKQELRGAEELARQSGQEALVARVKIERARQLVLRGKGLEEAYGLLQEAEGPLFASEDPDREYYQGRWLEEMVRTGVLLDRQRVTRKYLGAWKDFLGQGQQASRQHTTALYFELAIAASLAVPSEVERQETLALADRTIAAALETGSRSEYVQAKRIRGRLLGGEEGRRDLEEAASIAGSPGGNEEVARLCRSSLANLLAAQEPERARALIDEVLEESRKDRDSWSLLFLYDDAVEVAWATRRREEALDSGFQALEALEALRQRQDGEIARAGVFATWMTLFERQIGRLLSSPEPLERRDLERAFDVLERKRARVLLEALEISGAGAGRKLPDFPSLSEIEKTLAPNEALLSFQLAYDEDLFGGFAGGSWLLVSTRSGSRRYPLKSYLDLDGALEGLVSLEDPEEDPALLSYLHEELLGPAVRELPAEVERLLILPDRSLHQLPFGALRPTGQSEPLISRFELWTLPSATLWWQRKTQEQNVHDRSFLVLAGPDLRGVRVARGLVRELPHAVEEGRKVLQHLGGESQLLMGRDASESQLGQILREKTFGGLHFGAHARADDLHPDRSAIYLAPGAGNDGLLTPKEIVALDLPGGLVALAACHTASGEVLRGEGVMSLARYFVEGGADVVVGSLKELPDEESSIFFDFFYRDLARGLTVGAALASAQREARRQGLSARTWSNLVVFGDASQAFRMSRAPIAAR